MIIIISMQFTYIRMYCIWGELCDELAASLHIKGAHSREIRRRVFFTQSKPVWVDDLGTTHNKKFDLDLKFLILFFKHMGLVR